MKNVSIAERILEFLENNPGRHKTAEIMKAIGGSRRTSSVLGELAKNSEITKIKNGTYSGNPSAQAPPNKQLNEISEALRTAEDNKKTADTLMNIYDDVLHKYKDWIAEKIDSNIDFEKQLLFIENFKWLTAIGDKLMKRWSLEHVGYDTNTRQAQEDAKAKTAEREKAALEDAPLKDRIQIVGKYDPEAEELLDCIPTSLEQMSDEETEKLKV